MYVVIKSLNLFDFNNHHKEELHNIIILMFLE